MKFDKNLASIHGYLCGDGYVVKNGNNINHKYYRIGFRNTNNVLLEDFQKRFKNYFGLEPHIYRLERCQIGNKKIYFTLTKNFSYYSYQWRMPKLSKDNLKYWLRAFFDCDSWVELRNNSTRSIRLECVNLNGLKQIKKALLIFDINSSSIKTRNRKNILIYRLNICGVDNMKKFNNYIGYLHQNKKILLKKAIKNCYYNKWVIPKNKKDLILFIKRKGRNIYTGKHITFLSIRKYNLINLKNTLNVYNIKSFIEKPNKNNLKYYILKANINDYNNFSKLYKR